MKKKMYLLLALMLIGMKALSEEQMITNESDKSKETEIEVSLDNETVTSTNGIDVVYGPNRFKVFDIRRDTAKNRMYIDGDFTLDSYQPTGDIRIESKNGVALLDGSKAVFDTTFGYMQVGKVTGAEAPNDKIYFGGEKAKFDNGVVLLKNAWFTTDPKVNTNRDLTGLGYYIQSDKIKIEPDKQVTLTGSDLFIQDFDVMPFTFPWYRFNIRQGSQVPLFPMWGDEEDYGWTISTGMLYESKDGKYKGGFAPKFGDQMGLLVGRMENWYDTGTYGESRLNITDLLLYKKDKNQINSETGRPEASSDDRWDIEYTHKYDGDYGHFDFGVQSMTYNMNDTLKDIIEDYDAAGKFNHKDKNGNPVKGDLGEIPSMGDYSNFYTLDTSLTGLGERKDITIDAKVKLTDDKKAYQYIVNDQIDDLGYDSQVDNDLFSNVSLVKDNEDYKISGYYNYLYDMDPGSNVNDLQSRAEDFGFGFEDKNRKISLSYDEKNGDLYRRLNSWERNPDLSKLKTTDKYGLKADYVPWTVAMYDVYDSRNFSAAFGEYDLTKNISFKTGYDYTFSEKELNLQNDPMREKVFDKGNRWSQYNRYENITYEKIEEQRAFVDLYTGLLNFTFAGGRREETIHSREGVKSSDLSSRIFKNESDFYEFGINKNNIGLGYLGEIDIFGNIRQDKFKSGYYSEIDKTTNVMNVYDTDNNDKTTRYQAGLNHRITLLDNSGNADRWADIGLNNEFKFFYQNYKYDGNSSQEHGRLINKDNTYTYGDTVSFEFGNTETVYTGEYTLKERPENDEKSGEIFKNKVDFLIDGDKALSAYYNTDERYSDDYDSVFGNRYNNDLGYKDYGANIYVGNHEFYYKNQSIDFSDDFFKGITEKGLSEEIRENVFGYTYSFGENRLNFEYTQGTDKAKVENDDVLDIDNRTYAVTYINGGEIEHSYSVKYEDYQGNYKPFGYYAEGFKTDYNSNVITLRYGFKDKRLSESELSKYAEREYGKDRNDLTSQDINNIRSILENRNSTAFNLNSVMNNKVYFGDYRRSFDARLTLESNDNRRDQESYWDSLSKIEAAVFYSQNRIGLGYTFTQEADYSGGYGKDNWKVTERDHEFSFHAKIGKPSEGWRLRTYVQFYDNIDVNYGDGSGRRFFDEAGVEIGKEMGYYEWSLAYVREYSISTRDYEWKTALQFTLLTFPDKRLFGIGAKGDSGNDSKVKPDVHVFSGLKVEDQLGDD